jgi:DNA-directed RNA polymerase subunit K/omega
MADKKELDFLEEEEEEEEEPNEEEDEPNEEDNDDDDYDDEYDNEDDDDEPPKNIIKNSFNEVYDDNKYDDDQDDDLIENEDENYLQKFNDKLKEQILIDYHPELKIQNFVEVEALSRIVRNEKGVIIDPLHKTIPFITRYEKARILGERAKQINNGAIPFVEVDETIIDGYLIALKEYEAKKIPFIIKRPIPNGGCEFWKFEDLEQL